MTISRSNLTYGNAEENLDYQEGGSCIHTKTISEQKHIKRPIPRIRRRLDLRSAVCSPSPEYSNVHRGPLLNSLKEEGGAITAKRQEPELQRIPASASFSLCQTVIMPYGAIARSDRGGVPSPFRRPRYGPSERDRAYCKCPSLPRHRVHKWSRCGRPRLHCPCRRR